MKKATYSLNASDRDQKTTDKAEKAAAQIVGSPVNGTVSVKAETIRPPPKEKGHTFGSSLHLSPAESNAAIREKEISESWRSCLLRYETDLRELVADGIHAQPLSSRIMKVMNLYDCVIRTSETQSEFLAEFLRLFRVEFCRAIFSNHDIGLGMDDGQLSTYFEQVNSLIRENALLSTEIALGNTKERVAELVNEVDQLTETINVYKIEIERLTRQKDQALEQCRKSRETVENLQSQYESHISKSEKELQSLNVENKDMQLQLFRLRKQVAGGRAKLLKDTYTQMKFSKMSMMTTLFSEGDERIGLLVFMSQLESRLNETLDNYDNEFILSSEILHSEIRRKMGSSVAVILEEIHLCEQNYKRLVPKTTESSLSEEVDETDCFVALMFDPKIYEKLLNREAVKKRIAHSLLESDVHPVNVSSSLDTSREAAEPQRPDTMSDEVTQSTETARLAGDLRRSSHQSPLERRDTTDATKFIDEDCSIEEVAFKKKGEWLDTIFSKSTMRMILTKYGLKVSVEAQEEGAIPPDMLMPRLLSHPLKDLSSSKFLRGIEVFSGANPAQQKFLCAVNYIDPSAPIQLPDLSNFIKLKYQNSFKKEEPAGYDMVSRPFSSSASKVESPRRKKSAEGKRPPSSAVKQVADWGAKTPFRDEKAETTNEDLGSHIIFSENENLKVFRELQNPSLFNEHSTKQQRGSAMTSTATTVAFQRLNPLAPNRAPEWTLYKSLFGGYRSFTPRMIDISTVDHIMLCSCERHFTRLECRFEHCLNEANLRATTNQMSLSMAERFFRESYELTDFQEALIDELESRYVFPELVAKNLYEILCYLDAMAPKDSFMNLYMNVVRGFEPPIRIHYTCFLLYHLSYSWPSCSAQEEVSRDDSLTVLRFLYRNTDSIVRVDINETLHDFDMATRSASLTLMSMRTFLASASQHQEEPLLFFLNGAFARTAEAASNNFETSFDSYSTMISKNWDGKFDEKRNLVRFLSAGLGFNKGPLLSTKDLAFVAASAWCSKLWY